MKSESKTSQEDATVHTWCSGMTLMTDADSMDFLVALDPWEIWIYLFRAGRRIVLSENPSRATAGFSRKRMQGLSLHEAGSWLPCLSLKEPTLIGYDMDIQILHEVLKIISFWILKNVYSTKSSCTWIILFHNIAAAKSLHLCPTRCDPIDSSPPGSPVPGILQARTPEWVAISFSIHIK